MTKIEELHYIKELLNKHDLPLSPILEYAIKEREEQYTLDNNNITLVRENDPVFDVYKELEDYMQEFANLSVSVSKGKKLPHKAILLIALMDLIETGMITDNRIELNNMIAKAFSSTWNKYFDTNVPTVWTPFYHLKGESFWHFKANGNEDKLTDLLSFGGTPSVGKMRPIIKYAFLDKSLFDYMENDGCRDKLREVLIKTYIYQKSTSTMSSIEHLS